MNFVCPSCGRRADVEQECPKCPEETLLDLRKPIVVDLLRDTEDRLQSRRDRLIRWLSVVTALLAGITPHLIPGFKWPLRLPFFGHWFLFVIAVGVAATMALDRLVPRRKRFPFLDRPERGP